MIYRCNKDNKFTKIDNRYLQNTKLSWAAKGLFTYILSLPDEWQLQIEHLKKQSSNGKTATQSAFKELIRHRYIVRGEKQRVSGRFYSYKYYINEVI